MALGNNLKKKKIISGKEAEGKQDVVSKKELKKDGDSAASKKTQKILPRSKKKAKPALKALTPKRNFSKKTEKKLLEEPVKQISTAQQLSTALRQENFPEQIANVKLPVYIAKKLSERKKSLRSKYKGEVAALKDRNIQFVIMQIDEERYAIAIDSVKEVVPVSEISKIPNTSSHVKGIASVRGNTYAVFDLADKFKVKGDEFPGYLLVLNNRKINACLILSILPSTLKVNGNDISSDMQIIEDAIPDVSYIKGIIQHHGRLIYYLDIIQLIKNEKAIVIPDNILKQVNE